MLTWNILDILESLLLHLQISKDVTMHVPQLTSVSNSELDTCPLSHFDVSV